jgi:hypothetical protein
MLPNIIIPQLPPCLVWHALTIMQMSISGEKVLSFLGAVQKWVHVQILSQRIYYFYEIRHVCFKMVINILLFCQAGCEN